MTMQLQWTLVEFLVKVWSVQPLSSAQSTVFGVENSEDWWSLADIHLPHLAVVQKHKYHGNCWLNDPHVDFEHIGCAVRGWYSASRVVNTLRSYILGGKMDPNPNIQHFLEEYGKNTSDHVYK